MQAKLLTSFVAVLLGVEEAEERTTDDTQVSQKLYNVLVFHYYYN